jgi:hypothetical protein
MVMKKIYALMIALFLVNGAMAQWFPQNSGTTINLTSVYFTDANAGFIVGDWDIILKTIDGGTNWGTWSSGTNNWLKSVFFLDDNTGYVVGDLGTILKTTNGGGYVGINDHNQTVSTLNIYPNPAIDIIIIETPAKGSLSILNASSQKLMQKQITEPATTIDVSGWKSGVYFVKVAGENGVQVGKFIKQ